jgi:glutaredoxin 3
MRILSGVKPVRIYTTPYCPYCVRAKKLLQRKNVVYEEIDIGGDDEARMKLIETTGRRTVPQVFIGDTHVGGSDDLYALEESGELDRLLQ